MPRKNLFCFVVMLFLGCMQLAFAFVYPPSIQSIKDRGVLRVGMYYEDTPPLFMHDKQGHLVGSDVKLAKEIAKTLEVKVKFIQTYLTYNDVVKAVADHEVDVGISFLTDNLERNQYVTFTQPYLRLRMGLILNRITFAKIKDPKDKNYIQTLNKKGIKIGVLKGSSLYDRAEDIFTKAELVPYQDLDDAIVDVKKGEKLTAVFCDEYDIKRFILAEPQAALQVERDVIDDVYDPIAIAVPWNSFHLAYFINQFLIQNNVHYKLDNLFRHYTAYFEQTLN